MKNEFFEYEEHQIASWQEFDNFYSKSSSCVYRGQGDAQWELKTGYERMKKVLYPMREQEMLLRFISQAGIYERNLPEKSDFVSWFSLMQHYGTGTRLLDVTRSKYIALFFAIMGLYENTADECAVWAFETLASDMNFYNLILKDEDRECVDTREVPLATPLKEYKEVVWRFAKKFICSDLEMGVSKKGEDDYVEKYKDRMMPFLNDGGVIRVVPRIQNKRMVAQAAEFLMPCTLRKSFMDNLINKGNGCNPKVFKLIIPRRLGDVCVKKLKEMNITWQTMYPDINGLAKVMNLI